MPVFAAGNTGTQGCGTLNSPGDNPAAFSVGSTNPNNGISSFSSRGPNPFSGRTGPDLAAPGGSGIYSSLPTNTYGILSGTSMAAPARGRRSGAAALGRAGPAGPGGPDRRDLAGDQRALRQRPDCGGVSGSQTPNNVFGRGRLDVLAAVQMVWQAGTLSGTVTDAVSGLPIAGAAGGHHAQRLHVTQTR